MWEIVNEGNFAADRGASAKEKQYSLYQLGQFYKDVTERIKSIDPTRLVTSGDGCLFNAQWHLYKGVKEGLDYSDWTNDTLEERLKAYVMLYGGVDVVSGHPYADFMEGKEYSVSDTDDTKVAETFELYLKESRRIGKVFYAGEISGAQALIDDGDYTDEEHAKEQAYIDSIVEAGVQLSHWWAFHTDRTASIGKYGWQVTDGKLFDAIKDGNKRLQEKWVVNFAVTTNKAWEGKEDTDLDITFSEEPTGTYEEVPKANSCGGTVSTIVLPLLLIPAALPLLVKKKKTKVK